MNIEILRKNFGEILTLEENAYDYSRRCAERNGDKRVKKIIAAVRDDELRHIGLAKRLIALIK